MPKVVVEQTGKGIKLANFLWAAMFFGGVYVYFANVHMSRQNWAIFYVLCSFFSIFYFAFAPKKRPKKPINRKHTRM